MRGRWLGPGSSAVTRRSCGRLRGTRAGNPVVDGRTRAVPSTSVENRSPIIRFAIRSGGKRAGYWRLRAGLKQPELFLEREGYGKKFHFSLHASGQWHMKEGRQERISWARPGEVVPGYTRVVGIVQPVATAVREDPPAEETMLVAVLPTLTRRRSACSSSGLALTWITAGRVRTPTARPWSAGSHSPPVPGPAASSPSNSRFSPVGRTSLVQAAMSCGGCGTWLPGDR
jgi:hypothetical protein